MPFQRIGKISKLGCRGDLVIDYKNNTSIYRQRTANFKSKYEENMFNLSFHHWQTNKAKNLLAITVASVRN